ncbi:MAG: helix-turn-helix domain-containing protein [Myxococcota bacterium]
MIERACEELEVLRDAGAGSAAVEEECSGGTPPPGFRPGLKPQRVIAISGAKGGVGKSLFSANLALYLATIGRQVIVVDADSTGSSLHTFLGVSSPRPIATYQPPAHTFPRYREPPRPALDRFSADPDQTGAWRLRDTPIPGLKLLHAGLDEPTSKTARLSMRDGLYRNLRQLEAEYLVVDLGAGFRRSMLDCWLQADLALFVTLPEPTAIENTYRFMRYAFMRHAQRVVKEPRLRSRLMTLVRDIGKAPPALDVLRHLEKQGGALADIVRDAMATFRFRMVLNQTRLRADLELGDRMRSAARRRLALHLDYLGYIDYDDTVWSCVRASRPLLVESPGTRASKSIEKIARRALSIEAGTERREASSAAPPESHHDLVEVARGANDEEIRRAYKRAREVYSLDSLCCYGLFDDAGITALRTRLDEAYDVLLDPARRRPYELSVFPSEPSPEIETVPEEPRTSMPPPAITPDTEFTGPLLRAVRESQRIDLKDVSKRTKVSVSHLLAIEEDAFDQLPASVYVRGFIIEFAKYLLLDPEQVSRTYVRKYRRYFEERN